MEAYGLRVGSESGSRSRSRSRGTYSSNSKYLEPTLELAKPVVSFNMSCAGPKYWRDWLLVGDKDDGRGAARSTPLPSLGRNLLPPRSTSQATVALPHTHWTCANSVDVPTKERDETI